MDRFITVGCTPYTAMTFLCLSPCALPSTHADPAHHNSRDLGMAPAQGLRPPNLINPQGTKRRRRRGRGGSSGSRQGHLRAEVPGSKMLTSRDLLTATTLKLVSITHTHTYAYIYVCSLNGASPLPLSFRLPFPFLLLLQRQSLSARVDAHMQYIVFRPGNEAVLGVHF